LKGAERRWKVKKRKRQQESEINTKPSQTLQKDEERKHKRGAKNKDIKKKIRKGKGVKGDPKFYILAYESQVIVLLPEFPSNVTKKDWGHVLVTH